MITSWEQMNRGKKTQKQGGYTFDTAEGFRFYLREMNCGCL